MPFRVKGGAMWSVTRVSEPSFSICNTVEALTKNLSGDANVGMVFLAGLINVSIHIYVQVCKLLELVT